MYRSKRCSKCSWKLTARVRSPMDTGSLNPHTAQSLPPFLADWTTDLYSQPTFQTWDPVLNTPFLNTLVNVFLKISSLEPASFAHAYPFGPTALPSTEPTNLDYTLKIKSSAWRDKLSCSPRQAAFCGKGILMQCWYLTQTSQPLYFESTHLLQITLSCAACDSIVKQAHGDSAPFISVSSASYSFH